METLPPRAYDKARILRRAVGAVLHSDAEPQTADEFVGRVMKASGGGVHPREVRVIARLLYPDQP